MKTTRYTSTAKNRLAYWKQITLKVSLCVIFLAPATLKLQAQEVIPPHQVSRLLWDVSYLEQTTDTVRYALTPAQATRLAPQLDRPNFRSNLHIIDDTTSVVNIRVSKEGQIRDETVVLSDFRLEDGVNMAVIHREAAAELTVSESILSLENRNVRLQGMVLPNVYIARVKTPYIDPESGENITEQLMLRVMYFIEPLIYKWQGNNYETELLIMLLDDSETMPTRKELVEPHPVEFFTSGHTQVEPVFFEFTHTNLPMQRVRVTDASPQNPVLVRMINRLNLEGDSIFISKESLIRIDTPPRSLQGWGVQSIPIGISLMNYMEEDSVRVNLTATMGTIPGHVYVSRDKPGRVLLRSESTGESTITARADNFHDTTADFQFVLPVMFVLLTLIGGIIGGVLKHLLNPAKKGIWIHMLQGSLAGFVVAILYYIIGLTDIFAFNVDAGAIYFNEFSYLGIAVLGSLFWVQIYGVLEKMVVKK
ncbi:MAG: hypothetical protein EA394_09435 [Bacteroidia bacterium]|nr:MAG: hypothetical protein EA394_09435 [Bacteroidia bacterium]